jgi:hypothetical protein
MPVRRTGISVEEKMKTILATVSAIGLLAAAPAYAQSTGEVLLNATVTKACGVDHHKSGAQADANWDQSDITVNLADGNGQFTSQNTFGNRSFGNVWCNAPANVQIEVGSLVTGTRNTPPADAGSFSSEFDLKVTTDAGVYTGAGACLVLDTTGASGTAISSGATSGAFETGLRQYSGFSVEVLNPGNLRPIAGVYQGYVRFTASAI